MILTNKGPQIEPGAVEAPPAYDELEGQGTVRFSGDQKTTRNEPGPESCSPQAYEGQSSSSTAPSAQVFSRSSQSSAAGSGTGKTWFSWFSEKDTRLEVKRTIQSLMRDVLKEPASPAAVSVLQSCLEACQTRGLSFQSIVSEKFIEGHCPLYWAIIKRSATLSEEDDDRVQLLDVLLSIPMDATTLSEAYLACMLSSDQVLFQRLRHTPGDHSPSVSAAHELLIGDAPEDDVRSFDGEADHGEFRIVWKIAKFQKRMRAIGGVGTEVVARGRIWSLALSVLPRDTHISSKGVMQAGTWVASVSLLSPSPPTYLDAQFSIPEPITHGTLTSGATSTITPSSSAPPEHATSPSLVKPPDHSAASAATLPVTGETRKNSFLPWATPHRMTTRGRKAPITLRVRTDTMQLEALPLLSTKQDLRDHVLSQPGSKTLIVPLGSHAGGDSLQYDGCSYIHPDGSLNVILDGRLTKPGAGGDCIIC